MRTCALLLLLASAQAIPGQSPLVIEVQAPGYASRSVEQTVLTPLEQHLRGLAPVRRWRGLALDGRCLIRLDLTKDADPELARLLVQNHLALARRTLPPACAAAIRPPVDDALMLITLTPPATMPLADVSQLVHKTVWPELANVPGVAGIRVVGATEQRLRITVDPLKVRAYKLDTWEVLTAIQDSLKHVKDLRVLGNRVTVKNLATVDKLGEIPIKPGGNTYLRDVAKVNLADEWRENCGIALRTATKPAIRRAVFVLVQLSPGKLKLLAEKGLEKALRTLRNKLPDEVRCEDQLLAPNHTTVVMRWPDGMDMWQRVKRARAAADAMLRVPQVGKVCWLVQPGDSEGLFWVMTKAGPKADLLESLRAALPGIKGGSSRVGGLYSALSPWPGAGAQWVVRLQGKDRKRLQSVAERLRQRLRKTTGLVDVHQSPRMGEVATIEVDRELAGLGGTTVLAVSQALTAYADRFELPIFDSPWYITVEGPTAGAKTQKAKDLEILPIRSNNPLVNLMIRDVARVRVTRAPCGAISHEDGQPCVIVFGNLEGRTPEEARTVIRRITRELEGKGVRFDVE